MRLKFKTLLTSDSFLLWV